MIKKKLISALFLAGITALAAVACSEEDSADPTSAGGKGAVTFTSWGEEYIEDQIPAASEDGLVDGWTVKFSKFLVVIGNVSVADAGGKEAARLGGTKLVDHVQKGKKTLISFPDLPAQAYEKVGFQILPANAQTEVVGAAAADKDFMVQNGYALYIEGSATKDIEGSPTTGQVTKTFKWGFSATTTYTDCKAEQGGKETPGIVITSGGTDTTELTIHGDHFFYDRLQGDPTGQIPTNLRFEAVAKADDDGDKNGEITLDELAQAPIDLKLYDPSGFSVANMKELITALTRTVGHFRGEGECTATRQ